MQINTSNIKFEIRIHEQNEKENSTSFPFEAMILKSIFSGVEDEQ